MMCSRKVNSHDLEDSCISTAVRNEATCFRSLSNTTFQQIQSSACPSLRAAGLLTWGREPAPGPVRCTERRAPTGESHLGVLFDDAACVGTLAHLFFKDDAWSVMLSELACRERRAWHALLVFVLARVGTQPLKGTPHGEALREVPWLI